MVSSAIPMRGIQSTRVVTPEGVRPALVMIEGERVAEVRPVGAGPEGMPVEEVDGVLMAGLVDTHVHVNEPGRTEWEGFVTATQAAAAGGVTSLVDMPLNCIPVTTTRDALLRKKDATDGELHVDVGFWGGVVPGNEGDLSALATEGALGAKAFLCHSGIDDFPKADEATLRAAMPRMKDAAIPLLAHAELELDAHPATTDPRKYDAWLGARPPEWEDAAIAMLIELCRETRCPVHVVHLSSAGALPMIEAAKSEGLPLTVETCPHYLCLRAEDVPDGATEYKCAPPIRGEENRARLWQGLLDGVIDFVVSDHSPCTPHLKVPERGDFIDAWGGIASLSLGLSSVWTEARARGADVTRVAEWLSARPARFAGVADRKGAIAPGLDADLVLWDPDATREVTASGLRFKHPVSPYLGRTLSGRVLRTWLRGAVVFDGDDVIGPHGRPLLHRGGTA